MFYQNAPATAYGRFAGYVQLAILMMLICLNTGCATINPLQKVAFEPDFPQEVQISRGRPNRVVDSLGNLAGIPNRLAILDRRIDNHQVSAETEEALASYLAENGLSSVMIRVNQYDPIGEWRRMVQNQRIRPIWKYTIGSFDLLKYTIVPGRVFGGDWYNPFTNTVNLYSDVPALAVSKAAYAQDIRNRLNPGAYAMIKEVPFLGVQHDTVATQTTLNYFEQQSPEAYQEAKNILVPNYGADVGGQIASVLPYGQVIGRIVGGTVGNVANRVTRGGAETNALSR